MTVDNLTPKAGRGGHWGALVRRLGTVTGLLGGVGAVAGTTSAAAQQGDYRSAAEAPAAWQAFARQLQGRFQRRLAADDDAARRFHDQLGKRGEAGSATPAAVTVRTWILPDGRVDRVEFNGLDPAAAINLRTLLTRDNVGAPPSDMLQPLHLRLTLRSDDQPAQRK